MNLFLSFHGIFMVHNHGMKTIFSFHGVLNHLILGHEKSMKIFHGKFMVLWGHKIPVKIAIIHGS